MLRVFTAFSGYDSQCLAQEVIKRDSVRYINDPRTPRCHFICDFHYELVGWSEIDKYTIKAHNALFPQWADRNYGNISKIDWTKVPDFDLFTYSPPCQDFSQAGKQKGGTKGSGTRSSLLFENVSAIVNKKFIRLFYEWQLTLERLGYINFTQVLNAKTHGYPTPVPQNRERVFMFSILDCDKPFYFHDPQPLTQRLADILEPEVDESYYLSDVQLFGLIKQDKKDTNCHFKPNDGSKQVFGIKTNEGHRVTDNFVKVAANLHDGQNGTIFDPNGISPTICASEGVKTNTKILEEI